MRHLYGAIALSLLFLNPATAEASIDAKYIGMRGLPDYLVPGQTHKVFVTMLNNGTEDWVGPAFKLGAEAHWVWGSGRSALAPGEVVAPGASREFLVNIVAPEPWIHRFQWRMVREAGDSNDTWFGAFTPPAPLPVLPPPPGKNIDGLKTRFSRAGETSFRSSDKVLMAYFFYWWDGSASQKSLLTHSPKDLKSPPFHFRSIAWYEQELQDMAAAGVDVILPVYWGFPDERHAANEWSNGGLLYLVQAMRNLQARGITVPKIGMFADTSPHYFNPWGQLDFRAAHHRPYLSGTVRDFWSLIPTDLWAQIDGRPITAFYYGTFAAGYDQAAFDFLREDFQRNFGGKNPYLILDVSWKSVKADSTLRWSAAPDGVQIHGIAQVAPGADNSLVARARGNAPVIRDRRGGHMYWEHWVKAMSSGRNIIAVETWNEYFEGTEIAESAQFGAQYIRLTNHYSNMWREKKTRSKIVQHNMPAEMAPGQTATVSVTLLNDDGQGDAAAWSQRAGYKLASYPPENTAWGFSRVEMEPREYVPPGRQKTFTFRLTAPAQPGEHELRLGIMQEFIAWHEEKAPNTIRARVREGAAGTVVPLQTSAGAGGASAGPGSSAGTGVSASAVKANAVSATDAQATELSATRTMATQINAAGASPARISPTAISPTRITP